MGNSGSMSQAAPLAEFVADSNLAMVVVVDTNSGNKRRILIGDPPTLGLVGYAPVWLGWTVPRSVTAPTLVWEAEDDWSSLSLEYGGENFAH